MAVTKKIAEAKKLTAEVKRHTRKKSDINQTMENR